MVCHPGAFHSGGMEGCWYFLVDSRGPCWLLFCSGVWFWTNQRFQKENNYDNFHIAFSTLAARQTGMYGIPLDYLLRTEPRGNYNNAYSSRTEKLKACVQLSGPKFQQDSQSLYSLYVQHIGTEGTGSSQVEKFTTSRNGRLCFLDLEYFGWDEPANLITNGLSKAIEQKKVTYDLARLMEPKVEPLSCSSFAEEIISNF